MTFASTIVHEVEELPKMTASRVYVPRMSCSCLLHVQKTLQDQQIGLTQAPTKLLLLSCVPEGVRFSMCPLRVTSLFPPALGLLKASPAGLQSQTLWGLIFLAQDSPGCRA